MSKRGGQKIVVEGVARLPYFSHASVVGNLIFVSGTLGTTSLETEAAPESKISGKSGPAIAIASGGVGPETRQTLENIRTILAAAGVGLEDVAKVSIYVTTIADFAAMNAVYAEFFPPSSEPPARITLTVPELAFGAAVEIECVAVKPD